MSGWEVSLYACCWKNSWKFFPTLQIWARLAPCLPCLLINRIQLSTTRGIAWLESWKAKEKHVRISKHGEPRVRENGRSVRNLSQLVSGWSTERFPASLPLRIRSSHTTIRLECHTDAFSQHVLQETDHLFSQVRSLPSTIQSIHFCQVCLLNISQIHSLSPSLLAPTQSNSSFFQSPPLLSSKPCSSSFI